MILAKSLHFSGSPVPSGCSATLSNSDTVILVLCGAVKHSAADCLENPVQVRRELLLVGSFRFLWSSQTPTVTTKANTCATASLFRYSILFTTVIKPMLTFLAVEVVRTKKVISIKKPCESLSASSCCLLSVWVVSSLCSSNENGPNQLPSVPLFPKHWIWK